MTLTCQHCGVTFDRPAARGPIPSYCRHACRQAAFRGRVRAEDRNAHDVFLTELHHAFDGAEPDLVEKILDQLGMTLRWRREGP